MTTRQIRILVSRWADNPWFSGAIGAGIILITQSGSAMAFLIVSLVATGLLSVRKALPMVIWGNGGGGILVLIAVLDIYVFILFLLGIAGISYYLQKPARFRTLAALLFGIGMLFFGLQWIRTSAIPLAQQDWFQSAIFFSKGSSIFALAAGTILSFAVQSSPAVAMVAIAMTEAGVLPVDQTIMIIYGTNIGSSLTVWMLSAGLKGTTKQLVMAQVAFNILVGVLFITLFYMEDFFGLPLVKALAIRMSPNLNTQMACVYLLFNVTGALILSFFLDPLHRFLNNFWPPTPEESKSKVQYIHDQALAEPQTAMDLAEKEQQRLAGLICEHLSNLRRGLDSGKDFDGSTTHRVFAALSEEIHAFLTDLMETNLDGRSSERLLNLINVQNLIVSLEDEIHQLAVALNRSHRSSSLQPLTQDILEGGETILLSTLDAMNTRDNTDIALLKSITGDRGNLMESVRKSYLDSEEVLDQNDKSNLLFVTNVFERSVWVMRQLAKTIEQMPRDSVSRE